MKNRILAALAGVTLAAMTQSVTAADQKQPGAQTKEENLEEVVVTGSLIRGATVVGAAPIAVTKEDITATGANNTSGLLATIPQAGLFMAVPAVQGGANTNLAVNRPTLRNLGNTSSGAASTLLLVNGHRLPGMGIRQTSPDVDALAPGAIERIEIVTDGGSATYGSDAVGGVINFITRKRYDGAETKLRYGFTGDYHVFDGDFTIGKDWGRGSAYITYNYESHTSLYGRDLDYRIRKDWVNNVLGDTQCNPGNVIVSGQTFALPGLQQGFGNRCDRGATGTSIPSQRRHSAFASITYDLNDKVNFTVDGYYFERENNSDPGPRAVSVNLNPTITGGGVNPYYLATINGVARTAAENFQFDLSPVLGDHTRQRTTTSSWGITPRVTVKLGADWQLNAFINVGEGNSEFKGEILNPGALSLQTAASAGRLNPLNLTAAPSLASVLAAADYYDYGRARNSITNSRVVLDGSLFKLPGGRVRAAIGAEYTKEELVSRIQQNTAANIELIPPGRLQHNIKALFAELNLPLLGEGSGIHALTLSLSGRQDKYSDYGSTFNPKFGLDFAPWAWLNLRGNVGKSFQAPSLASTSALSPSFLQNLGSARFLNPLVPALPGQTMVALGGVNEPLVPQTAKSFSMGFDLQTPFIDGLSISATYYRVLFKDQIAILPIFDPAAYAQFPDLIAVQSSPLFTALYNKIIALASNPTVLTSIPLANIYSVADGRQRNLATTDVRGIDFSVRYRRDMSWGSLFVNIGGNDIVNFVTKATSFAAPVDLTATQQRLRVSTTVGAKFSNLRTDLTWMRSGGFDVAPTVANLQQSKVGAYDVFNFFGQYDLTGTGIANDLSFTLNIDNLLDKDPPRYYGSLINNGGDGYANGFTLGRLIRVGVNKKF